MFLWTINVFYIYTEATVYKCSFFRRLILQISGKSHESFCRGVLFLLKLLCYFFNQL